MENQTESTENIELTPAQKMELAIVKARKAKDKTKQSAMFKLIDNEDYINYKATILEEEEEIARLTVIMEQLSTLKPIIAEDGSKYAVHCFPVAEYVFGPIVSRVLGIIKVVGAMFTEDRQIKFSAMTDVPYLEAVKANEAIGSPAYYSKGTLAPTIPSKQELVEVAITAVLVDLKIDIKYLEKFNKANLNKWFTLAEEKANKQYNEFQQMEQIDSTNKFVLED